MLALLVASVIAPLALVHPHHEGACHECDDWRDSLPPAAMLAVARVDDAQPRDPKHQRDLDNDIRLGTEYSAEIEKELKLSQDAEAIERVNRIGQSLAEIARVRNVAVSWGDRRLNPFDYTFKVIDEKDVNAFSIPGGFIYVYQGLIDYAETDDELAGVLAHEISHASFRHVATLRREQGKLANFTVPFILIGLLMGGESGMGVATAGALTNQAMASGWSVDAEKSADYGAVQYMIESGYNPVGVLTFMERLAAESRQEASIDWGIYRTHPPSRERAEAIKKHLAEFNVPLRRSQTSTSLRSVITPSPDGGFTLTFLNVELHNFFGDGAAERAEDARQRLDSFFDSEPLMAEVALGPEGRVNGGTRKLFQVHDTDAFVRGLTRDMLAKETVKQVKHAVYELSYRIWGGGQ